jgi:hypothetical protein
MKNNVIIVGESMSDADARLIEFISKKWNLIKNKMKDPEVQFRLLTSLKMTSIFLLSFILMASYIIILLGTNLVFFKANELIGISEFESIFYDSILGSLFDFAIYGSIILVTINIASIYISDLLLRPFRIIGDYCERKTLKSSEQDYNPDFFSELKILSQFSEFFFNSIESAAETKALQKLVIPKKYKKIHQPVFEGVFFFHFSFYVLGAVLMLAIAVITFTDSLYENLIQFAGKTLPNSPSINYFLKDQNLIFDQITMISLGVGVILYLVLSYHLYSRVSTPAFAFFATMRSFIKGNYRQRVHLIGYPYLRNQSRKFNKYLDWVEKELVSSNQSKT